MTLMSDGDESQCGAEIRATRGGRTTKVIFQDCAVVSERFLTKYVEMKAHGMQNHVVVVVLMSRIISFSYFRYDKISTRPSFFS